jgi:hypothetical protein
VSTYAVVFFCLFGDRYAFVRGKSGRIISPVKEMIPSFSAGKEVPSRLQYAKIEFYSTKQGLGWNFNGIF